MIRRSQLPSPLPSMRRHGALGSPPQRKRAFQKTCDYWRSRRLRSIAGWRNTTRQMTCGSGPAVTIPICGTSDFSLFELRLNEQSSMPDIKRVAVSEHILLGGDNIDLAIAHMVEPRLAGPGAQVSGPQSDHL